MTGHGEVLLDETRLLSVTEELLFPLMPGFAGFADARFMTVAVRVTNNTKHHSTFMLDLRHTALVM